MKFTDRQIKSLQPEAKRYVTWEENAFGLGSLGVRVSPVGRKTWIFMYRFAGKPRMLSLGTYPAMGVAEAHIMIGESIKKLQAGTDAATVVVAERIETRKAPTVEDLAREYVEKWSKPRKRSWKEDQRVLEHDVLPKLGRQRAKSVTRRDIHALLDSIVDRGAPVQANRTLAIVRKMFNYALSKDIVENNPCHRVSAPAQEQQRQRMLSQSEIQLFLNRLPQATMAQSTRLLLQFQLLTAQRCGEVATLRWDEIDTEASWWTISSQKAKNGLTHRVPLSKQACEILNQMKPLSNSDWVFSSPIADKPVTVAGISRVIQRNKTLFGIPHFTPHDLRRTAASHMTSIGISRLVVSKILNHVESGITAVYDRHSYDKEKREALDAWGRQVQSILD